MKIFDLKNETENSHRFGVVLLGTNLFTYATTRWAITKLVLTRATERVDVALKEEGLYEQIYSPYRPHKSSIRVAIIWAGGMYFWGNEYGAYFWGAVMLTITGILVPFVQPKRNPAPS